MGFNDLMKLDIQRFSASLTISSSTISQSIPNNNSTVRITCVIKRTSGSTYWVRPNIRNLTITCDGQTYTVGTQLPSNQTSVTYTHDFTVPHNSDGTKSINYSGSVAAQYGFPALSASGSATLNTIPRYAKLTQYDVYAVDETTIGVNWNADAACDAVSYSIDGSNWISTGGLTFYVGGLQAGTWHTISIAIKRADSQLWTYSYDTYEVKGAWTYSYPYVEYVTDFVIGSGNCNANLINPLGRQVTLDLISNNDGSIIGTYSGTYSGLVGAEFNTAEAIDKQYKSIPNNPGGTYYARVTYGQVVNTSSSKTYYVNTADCKPTFNLFTWEDTNATTLALTGSNQTIVKGYSNVEVTIPVADKATAKNYATITKYEFRCGDKTSTDPMTYSSSADVTGTIQNVSSNTFEVRAVDSRGLPSDWVSLVAQNFIQYENLTKGTATIHREGEVSSRTTVTFNGTVSLVDFGLTQNSITNVTYQYKTASDPDYTTGDTAITPTVDANGNFTFTGLIKGDTPDGFDPQNVYSVLVNVFDELSNPYITFDLTLPAGKPHLAWHKDGLAVMSKYDGNIGGGLQVLEKPLVYSSSIRPIAYLRYSRQYVSTSAAWTGSIITGVDYHLENGIGEITYNSSKSGLQINTNGLYKITGFVDSFYNHTSQQDTYFSINCFKVSDDTYITGQNILYSYNQSSWTTGNCTFFVLNVTEPTYVQLVMGANQAVSVEILTAGLEIERFD